MIDMPSRNVGNYPLPTTSQLNHTAAKAFKS